MEQEIQRNQKIQRQDHNEIISDQQFQQLKSGVDKEGYEELSNELMEIKYNLQKQFSLSLEEFKQQRKEINSVKEYTETLKALKKEFQLTKEYYLAIINKLTSVKVKNANLNKRIAQDPSIEMSYDNIINTIELQIEKIQEIISQISGFQEQIMTQYQQQEIKFKKNVKLSQNAMHKFQDFLKTEEKQRRFENQIFQTNIDGIMKLFSSIDLKLIEDLPKNALPEEEISDKRHKVFLRDLFFPSQCDKQIFTQINLDERMMKILFYNWVLSRLKKWKIQLSLMSKGNLQPFRNISIILIGKHIQRTDYQHLSNELQYKFSEQQFFGILGQIPVNLNLSKTQVPTQQVPNNIIDIFVDQLAGKVIFNYPEFEYRSDKLQKAEEYRIAIMISNNNTTFEMKIIQ